MKKLYIILFIFIFLCSFINYSYANDGIVYLNSDESMLEINDNIEITLYIKNAKTAAYTVYLNFDNSKLEYISGPDNSNVVNNCVIHVWYDDTGGYSPKDGKLAKFVFKLKEDGNSLINVKGEFYDCDGKELNIDFKDYEIKNNNFNNTQNLFSIDTEKNLFKISSLKEENTNLETLAIENFLLYPFFDTSVTRYNLNIPYNVEKLNILAIPEIENAKVRIEGNNHLLEGENIIKIFVTSENGLFEKEYVINVYKRSYEEENNYNNEQIKNKEELQKIYSNLSSYGTSKEIQNNNQIDIENKWDSLYINENKADTIEANIQNNILNNENINEEEFNFIGYSGQNNIDIIDSIDNNLNYIDKLENNEEINEKSNLENNEKIYKKSILGNSIVKIIILIMVNIILIYI